MSIKTRENIIQGIETDLASARRAAEQARQFAVDCANNNSISGSGERAVAEGQSASWQSTVTKLEKLRNGLNSAGSGRVSLGALADVEIDGESFTAVISDVNCQLSNEGTTVVTPQSPLGKVLLGHGSGETVEYQVGADRVQARIKRIF